MQSRIRRLTESSKPTARPDLNSGQIPFVLLDRGSMTKWTLTATGRKKSGLTSKLDDRLLWLDGPAGYFRGAARSGAAAFNPEVRRIALFRRLWGRSWDRSPRQRLPFSATSRSISSHCHRSRFKGAEPVMSWRSLRRHPESRESAGYRRQAPPLYLTSGSSLSRMLQ
jgi:hypothetical protein